LFLVETGLGAGPDRLANDEARHKADFLAHREPAYATPERGLRLRRVFSRS
jgi:hypothetical protein